MYGYFFGEFKKRGVLMNNQDEKALLSQHWYFRRNYSYDFNFSTDYRTEGFLCNKIKICFYPLSESVFVRFDWTLNSGKKHRMSAKSFSQKKLTNEKVLGLISQFMKGDYSLDNISRKAFLKEFNDATTN